LLTTALVTVIQPTDDVAVQEHPAAAVTPIVPVFALELMERVVGFSVMLQELVPLCVTVTDWPATVSVPVRLADVVLLVAVNATEPAPIPPEPTPGVSQAAPLDTDQAQPVPAVTPTLNEPPLADIDCVSGDTT
jgi:hypothetical protein